MLEDLPFEVLVEIASHLPTASSLASLSLTNKRLRTFIEKEGFRSFVQSQFPFAETPALWKEAARALVSGEKAWDQKAVLARAVQHPDWKAPARARNGRSRQTIGYVPVIDSYEQWEGKGWSDRREILAWGSGADLTLRVKRPRRLSDPRYVREEGRAIDDNNIGNQKEQWSVYKETDRIDGPDDITSVNLLRPYQQGYDAEDVNVIVGRASGELEHTSINIHNNQGLRKAAFDTKGRGLQSADLSHDPHPLLVAALSERDLAVYSPELSDTLLEPLSDIRVPTSGNRGARIWTTKFLSSEKIALGIGPSSKALYVYHVGPTGLYKDPLLKFDFSKDPSNNQPPISSVYPIIPLPPSSQAGASPGDLFLSGWYHSQIMLHDLRSPSCAVTIFNDTVDTSPIYSLVPIGRDHFLAGSGRNQLLKMFDIRFPCAQAHSYHSLNHTNTDENHSRGANIFLRNQSRSAQQHAPQNKDSPIYALSTPSPTSQTIYAGLESTIVSLDLIQTRSLPRLPRQTQRSLLAHKNGAFTLAGYERPRSSTAAAQLLVQRDLDAILDPESPWFVGEKMGRARLGGDGRGASGLDERWLSRNALGRDSGDRWR